MRVLICEDSRTYAAVLSHAVQGDGEVEVAAVCRTAEEAIALLPSVKPDLVTMDIELPGISGLEAVERIMTAHPVPILVLSSRVRRDSEVAAAALAAGALDAVGKDELDLMDPVSATAVAFRQRLKVLAKARVIRHPRARLNHAKPRTGTQVRSASVIGICASTGGPQALGAVLAQIPESFPIPILLVQHISIGFTEGFVRWLDGVVEPPVRMADATTEVGPGIWVAPEEAHLVLRDPDGLALDRDSAAGLHRPSANTLFESIAEHAGGHAVGVVLTGMGRDGADGLEAIRRAGGLTVAQDEGTCAVFGMPRAAAEQGAELILPPREIGDLLCRLLPLEKVA
jgi:two-component system, chemotaxis family, protein-glutamate methylesterase/glutaminase